MTFALLGALLIGLSLGLLGSGGSILTVPVLVYLVEQDEKVAIAGSLFIVGTIALAGSIPYARQELVHWRSVLWFGVPGMGGTLLGAYLSEFLTGTAQLAIFAFVMLLAAGLMIRPAGSKTEDAIPRARAPWKIVLDGLLVGALTGLVGVGGGFLIVPALVLLGGLSMRLAVGTSLLIIALKSSTGFAKYLSILHASGQELDWQILGLFSALGIVGTFAGRALGGRIPQQKLRRIFGGFLVVMAAYILVRELGSLG
ncbi:MAG: sulfite exporter TauE/SafE family protein [Planctomycetota bacterium]